MNQNINLIKYDKSIELDKIRYLFMRNSENQNWVEKYKTLCMIKGIEPLEQDSLTDFEYYIKVNPLKLSDKTQRYYLLVDNNPVTLIIVNKESKEIADITFTTASKYRGKGYATKSVELIEKILLKNKTIRFIKMVDISPHFETTKIAQNLHYEYDENMQCFYKINPNYVKERDSKLKHK